MVGRAILLIVLMCMGLAVGYFAADKTIRKYVPHLFPNPFHPKTAAELVNAMPLSRARTEAAIAVGGEDHTYQFPGLLTEIVAGGFKFLSGPGPFHAVLP